MLAINYDNTLEKNMWTPKEYYDTFDTKSSKYQLLKGSPLVRRISYGKYAGNFVKEEWLEKHISKKDRRNKYEWTVR